MKAKRRNVAIAWLSASILLVGLTLLVGCGTSEPKSEVVTMTEPVAIAQPAVQTTCPIMGMPIDKNIYTEYKGKKVYFCCASCIASFNKDPEKYVAKLPQFNK